MPTFSFLLLLALFIAAPTLSASSPSLFSSTRSFPSSLFSTRGGGGGSATITTAAAKATRRSSHTSNNAAPIRHVKLCRASPRRKPISPPRRKANHSEDAFYHQQQQRQQQLHLQNRQHVNDEPTLDEMRAQLGPIAMLVSNTIELTVVTVGSLVSGGLMGYVGGGVLNAGILFGKTNAADAAANAAANNLFQTMQQRFSLLNTKAFSTAKNWAVLSAAFSGFHNFVRLCRGGNVEDKWNGIWGSALTGAFLNRGSGAQAMVQGAATYAGFTYFIDKFFSSPSPQQQQRQAMMYTDVPIDDY